MLHGFPRRLGDLGTLPAGAGFAGMVPMAPSVLDPCVSFTPRNQDGEETGFPYANVTKEQRSSRLLRILGIK